MTISKLTRSSVPLTQDMLQLQLNLYLEQNWLIEKSEEVDDVIELGKTLEEQTLIIYLLERIQFYTAKEHLENLKLITEQVVNTWGCTSKNSLIVALENHECAGSGSMIVTQLKSQFSVFSGWGTHNFLNGLSAAVSRAKDGDTIILVDDFSGTGKSISKKVIWLQDNLKIKCKKVSIRVAVCAAMTQSKKNIEPIVVQYYATYWLAKGISDNFVGAELTSAINAMTSIESELGNKSGTKKLPDYSFGYKRSESLFYTEGANPPNNNFPIFWWTTFKNKKKRTPLLGRI